MLKAFASLLLVAGMFAPGHAAAQIGFGAYESPHVYYNGTVGILSVVGVYNINERSGSSALVVVTTRNDFEWLKARARIQSPVLVELSGTSTQLMLYVDHASQASGRIVATGQRVYIIPPANSW